MKICEAKTINLVNSKIEVSFVNATMESEEERAERLVEKKEIESKLNNYANHVYGKCLVKNGLI